MASILRVNTLTDASSNNSVPMATVNQGTAKSWADFTMASTPSADDSFNLASITDVGTGKMGIVVTSVFATVNYAAQGYTNGTTGNDFNSTAGLGLKQGQSVTTSTSTYEFSAYAGSYVDAIHNYTLTHGDLA
jgi:hypothetical protein